MIDGRLRQALEAIDEVVAEIGAGGTASLAVAEPARLVVDVGRAAAEWRLRPVHPDAAGVRIAVICDIEHDRVTDVRLYVGVESEMERGHAPREHDGKD